MDGGNSHLLLDAILASDDFLRADDGGAGHFNLRCASNLKKTFMFFLEWRRGVFQDSDAKPGRPRLNLGLLP
jgi:hypothetical protein